MCDITPFLHGYPFWSTLQKGVAQSKSDKFPDSTSLYLCGNPFVGLFCWMTIYIYIRNSIPSWPNPAAKCLCLQRAQIPNDTSTPGWTVCGCKLRVCLRLTPDLGDPRGRFQSYVMALSMPSPSTLGCVVQIITWYNLSGVAVSTHGGQLSCVNRSRPGLARLECLTSGCPERVRTLGRLLIKAYSFEPLQSVISVDNIIYIL